MRVFIDRRVEVAIYDFYEAAMSRHITLDEQTVLNKENRLYAALQDLGKHPRLYAPARFLDKWKDKDFLEFICEDFHFAYQVMTLETGEEIVYVFDACHSMLYHN